MSLRTARLLAGAYVVAMAVAVTWPGAVPAARVEPMVLGLPFAFFWPALWVGLGVPVLYALDRVERRYRDGGTGRSPGGDDETSGGSSGGGPA